jgi:hypothetical protein
MQPTSLPPHSHTLRSGILRPPGPESSLSPSTPSLLSFISLGLPVRAYIGWPNRRALRPFRDNWVVGGDYGARMTREIWNLSSRSACLAVYECPTVLSTPL